MTDHNESSSDPSPQSVSVSGAVWMFGGLVITAVGALGALEFFTNFRVYGVPHAILMVGMSAMVVVVGLQITIDAVGDLIAGVGTDD